jgi:N-acetylmuramoyl-L-alanine amidase
MKPSSLIHPSFWSRILLIGGIVAILATGCARGPKVGSQVAMKPLSVVGQTPFRTPHNVYHIVGPSETLWRISKTYDVDMNTLLKVNHLSDPTKIKNGQRLLIPKTLGPKAMIPLVPARRWTHIVIHHTATHEGDAFTIDELHHKRGFWNGLGYHFLINNGTNGKVDGQIQVGPRWIKQLDGAHCNAADMNQKGIGIVAVGNFSEQRLSESELESLVFLVRTLQQYYHIPNKNVLAHRNVPGKSTECPGTRFPWSEFKRRIL